MKTEVVIYRIISVLLLPITVLFGLSTLMGLVSVIINPSALIGVLLIGSVVFYIISSFIFLNKGIINAKPSKPSLRSSIRISAYISAFFCIMVLYLHLTMVNDPTVLNELAMQMQSQPALPKDMTQDILIQSIKTLFTFFMIVSLVLLLHIIMTFRMLKQYSMLFEEV